LAIRREALRVEMLGGRLMTNAISLPSTT
jgi:hypothetical protein